MPGDLYSFVFRAQLAEEALDRAGRKSRPRLGDSLEELAESLNFDLFDQEDLSASAEMAAVYTAIAAFERSVRRFIERTLRDKYGDDWWEKGVQESIRKRAARLAEQEQKLRFLGGRRRDSEIDYTMIGDLSKIAIEQWPLFEVHLQRQDWLNQIVSSVESARNVIMHAGDLDREDLERLSINIRDWIMQVGA